METFLKDKKISVSVFILLVVVSLLALAKLVNEVRLSPYVGRGNQPANVFFVEGKGEVIALSDIATLSINLEKDGRTAKEAQDLLNESITKTLTYLKDQKIEDKDIKSAYGGLTPKYSYENCYTYSCPKNAKIIGYTATQSINVKIREVDNASVVRTGLADLGVTNISGPDFSIDEDVNYKDQARAKAIADARAKAEVLAKDLGIKIGKVVNFSENNSGGYPMYEAKSMMAQGASADVAAPTLPKGENTITSSVTITYEIK